MKTKTKVWLILAASLILVGGILFVGVMMMHGWNFAKLSTVAYETNRHEIGEEYQNITVLTKTADVVLVAAEGDVSEVTCYESKNLLHKVGVKDGTLVIEVADTRKWYEYIGINFGIPKITVSLPAGEYGALTVRSDTGDVEIPKDFSFVSVDVEASTGDVTFGASTSDALRIKLSTGDIRMEQVAAGAIDLKVTTGSVTVDGGICKDEMNLLVSTGDARLSDVSCGSFFSKGSTGDLFLKDLIATESLSAERSTGKIKLEKCDAAALSLKTSTGAVSGTLLSEKIFITHTDTGRVDVPSSSGGGRCEITTDTGDIRIRTDA